MFHWTFLWLQHLKEVLEIKKVVVNRQYIANTLKKVLIYVLIDIGKYIIYITLVSNRTLENYKRKETITGWLPNGLKPQSIFLCHNLQQLTLSCLRMSLTFSNWHNPFSCLSILDRRWYAPFSLSVVTPRISSAVVSRSLCRWSLVYFTGSDGRKGSGGSICNIESLNDRSIVGAPVSLYALRSPFWYTSK